MHKDKMDQVIVDILTKETNEATKLKDETWEQINHQLFSNQVVKGNFRKKRLAQMVVIAAIITIVIVSFSTSKGQAIIQNLKDMFVEEKDYEVELEGQKEKTHVELEANEELRYIIYVDQSRYKLIDGEESDLILPSPELGDDYPDVFMEIRHIRDTSITEIIQDIKQELSKLNMEITGEEKVDLPIEATLISAIGEGYTNEAGKTGPQWDTPVRNYYITNDKEGQFFVITEVYFLEASEGHGARFSQMLETFEVVH